MFKVGDKVKVVDTPCIGDADIDVGDIGVVVAVGLGRNYIEVTFPEKVVIKNWIMSKDQIKLVSQFRVGELVLVDGYAYDKGPQFGVITYANDFCCSVMVGHCLEEHSSCKTGSWYSYPIENVYKFTYNPKDALEVEMEILANSREV